MCGRLWCIADCAVKQPEVSIMKKFNGLPQLSNQVGMLVLILQISEVSHGMLQHLVQNQAAKE